MTVYTDKYYNAVLILNGIMMIMMILNQKLLFGKMMMTTMTMMIKSIYVE